jgi:hypothetical protein
VWASLSWPRLACGSHDTRASERVSICCCDVVRYALVLVVSRYVACLNTGDGCGNGQSTAGGRHQIQIILMVVIIVIIIINMIISLPLHDPHVLSRVPLLCYGPAKRPSK